MEHEKDYVDFSKSDDVNGLAGKFFYRFFESLPALLSLGTLLAIFVLSWRIPATIAFFVIAFDLYWLLRIIYLSAYQISGYKKMRENLKIDWLEKVRKLKTGEINEDLGIKLWGDLYHLIILPFCKEGEEVVASTIRSLRDSKYPKEKIIVVLSGEERAGEGAKKITENLGRKFNSDFFKFIFTVHPKAISGEIAGKGSNATWALKKAKEFIDGQKIPYERVIVSSFDVDTRAFPQYFSCLAWNYLTARKPLRESFQPIPVYNNNIWDAPSFSRIISFSGTFWQMMQQEREEQLVTYSSHAIPFKVLAEVGYPSNIVSDDSRIFWKAYLHYDGNYRAVPLHYPISMDAVLSENTIKTMVSQYKQQRRWASGVENIPYLFYGFLKNKKIKLRDKIYHSFVILEGFWSWAVAALLIFLLGWLPLMLGGKEFNDTLLSYNLPRLTSYIMTIAMVGMVVSAVISILILPTERVGNGMRKKLFIFFQWFFLPITLIAFGAFPALESQVRLMVKKPLGFWVTEKTRKL
ncbi:MAG: hypothetical protein COX37_00940 [Candidatus Nealsonbacteria bacterium CG23_combo_of_CG06-09_8_20_14_all_39_17]|uniref:Glycosyltransferase 2-like domain-containing protein n=1 Tax=Candidatus Nealsonbacteria bacterium CG23_combo_of_CG06-09_8_20_14_all_39_17 TaxID=1974722 RepID=A0A2G9YUS9_9BACT|nr:MAG: hypothetical protein COX37_00940 [Candidatus Nealsonbacteria bacterium CG23_combo_of_CG06-09_8_20_14_all_39_17]